jgi:hypothetical protein
MKQIQQISITELANRIEKESNLQMYWDYRDSLSSEQIIKIIREEEGLNEIENEIYDNNVGYIFEIVSDRVKEYLEENNIKLSYEEKGDLIQECECRFNFNINDLIKNSQIKIRLDLLSNEDMICFVDNQYKGSETIKAFKKRFLRAYKKEDLDKEILNVMNDYGLFSFYFNVKGLDILKFREQVLSGYITLRKGINFGIFNSWVGGGSVLEMSLLRDITLNIKDWRIKDKKEEIIKALEGEKSYYSVKVVADEIDKYGIQEVYGLTSEGWIEW